MNTSTLFAALSAAVLAATVPFSAAQAQPLVSQLVSPLVSVSLASLADSEAPADTTSICCAGVHTAP